MNKRKIDYLRENVVLYKKMTDTEIEQAYSGSLIGAKIDLKFALDDLKAVFLSEIKKQSGGFMKVFYAIKVRLCLFFWFVAVGFSSLFAPRFGHEVVKSYFTQLEKEKAEKINKLHS